LVNLSRERFCLDKRGKHEYGHSCNSPFTSSCLILTNSHRNYKPSESDLEDDDEDEDDEDISTWFEDDQDDGRKGQIIIEPDAEDFSEIIRIDENRVHQYNTFYEPRDDGD
jgi:hypothetical protein